MLDKTSQKKLEEEQTENIKCKYGTEISSLVEK